MFNTSAGSEVNFFDAAGVGAMFTMNETAMGENISSPANLSLAKNLSSSLSAAEVAEAKFMEDMRRVCEVWLSLPIAIAGIIGNLVSLVVLYNHKPMQTTTLVS